MVYASFSCFSQVVKSYTWQQALIDINYYQTIHVAIYSSRQFACSCRVYLFAGLDYGLEQCNGLWSGIGTQPYSTNCCGPEQFLNELLRIHATNGNE